MRDSDAEDRPTVAVAMSGGVDSSVCALLLRESGARVVGLTARLWTARGGAADEEGTRCAAGVCAALGIVHRVVDLRAEFQRDVVEYFVAEYAAGRTPSPCVVCNRLIKFGRLLDAAAGFGAARLATGHYARLRPDADGRVRLLKGVDAAKDQSYFLFDLAPEQLARLDFPLGERRKAEVRALAAARGLATLVRPESQDLCFVARGDHPALIASLRPDASTGGPILDWDGNVLGRHHGIHRFTVGQRKRLGIAAGTPLFVAALDARRNAVVVAPRERLMRRTAMLSAMRWHDPALARAPFHAQARLRYNQAAAPCHVVPTGPDAARVEFDEPQFAVAPGQAAVIYRADEVCAGGWIAAAAD